MGYVGVRRCSSAWLDDGLGIRDWEVDMNSIVNSIVNKMAREAGIQDSMEYDHMECDEQSLERFAELVRADEREAIAQMIEDAPPLVEFAQNHKGGCLVCGFTPKLAAEVIRARGNT